MPIIDTDTFSEEEMRAWGTILATLDNFGKWIDVRGKRLFGDSWLECSKCHYKNRKKIKYNYCPNCGAKME